MNSHERSFFVVRTHGKTCEDPRDHHQCILHQSQGNQHNNPVPHMSQYHLQYPSEARPGRICYAKEMSNVCDNYDAKFCYFVLIYLMFFVGPNSNNCLPRRLKKLISEDIPTLPFFPGVSHFWCVLPVSQFLSKFPSFWKNSKINVQVIETHVSFSDTCGNGLINLTFVPKSNSFFDRG